MFSKTNGCCIGSIPLRIAAESRIPCPELAAGIIADPVPIPTRVVKPGSVGCGDAASRRSGLNLNNYSKVLFVPYPPTEALGP